MTFDQTTVDDTGAFLVYELERLDQTLDLPLVNFTWSRDVQLYGDASIADEISSFTNTTFAATGTPNANGRNRFNKAATTMAGFNVDIVKTDSPFTLWGMELGWAVPESQAAAQVGRPIDTQKYDSMQLKWNMDTDEQIYIGDSGPNVKGLLGLTQVIPTGAARTWTTSTADEIRASINAGLSAAWVNPAYSMVPTDMPILSERFPLSASTTVSSAGNRSLLTYLEASTIAYHQNGRSLNIRPVKWVEDRGMSNPNRMMFYTNDKKYVRFPMVPLTSVSTRYRDLHQLVIYYGKLGAIESVYPETLAYVDGI